MPAFPAGSTKGRDPEPPVPSGARPYREDEAASSPPKGIRQWFRDWRNRARARNELMRFSDRELRDIGINRTDAWREIRKSLWRI